MRAYTALHYQSQVCAGDTVLVLDGASSFGSVAVQLARQWGAKVRGRGLYKSLHSPTLSGPGLCW